jgi:hypothetical protein
MQGTAYILVRSVVPNPNDRKAFDYWYETDHMPLLMSKIPGLRHAWRFWSTVDPSVHYSFGEFSDMTALRAAAQSDGFKLVLADYDRNWAKKGVTRTRDVMENPSRPSPRRIPKPLWRYGRVSSGRLSNDAWRAP